MEWRIFQAYSLENKNISDRNMVPFPYKAIREKRNANENTGRLKGRTQETAGKC